jgi:hypothetical protein
MGHKGVPLVEILCLQIAKNAISCVTFIPK